MLNSISDLERNRGDSRRRFSSSRRQTLKLCRRKIASDLATHLHAGKNAFQTKKLEHLFIKFIMYMKRPRLDLYRKLLRVLMDLRVI